jgi:hypothetical protein
MWSAKSAARYACLCAGLAGSLSACRNGTRASRHDGGGSDGQDAVDVTATADIHYGICELTDTTIFRIDRTATTCTFVVLAPAGASCPSGAMISDRCFSMAGFSTDVAACDALQIPAGAVGATGAAGTFTTRVTDPAGPGGAAIELADFDLTLTFPADAGVPTSDHFAGSGCLVACLQPTAACST